MNNSNKHRWQVAVVAALVMILAVPVSAGQARGNERERGFADWWRTIVTFVATVLGTETGGEHSDTGPHMDPNGGTNALVPGLPGGNVGGLDGQ